MGELVDKQLMLEDVKSWVAMDSYEQHLINNMSAWIENLPTVEVSDEDCISRRAAVDVVDFECGEWRGLAKTIIKKLEALPSVQPERVWYSCKTPPRHHKDVLVRGTEAIDNVTIYMVMQWDVDTWRPKNYAPSITWEEWSEIYE